MSPRVAVVGAFFAYVLLARVLPYVLHAAFGWKIERAYDAYPWNFSPLYALAIFGGTVLDRRLAIVLPLAVSFAGDLLIYALMGPDWAFYPDQPFTYLSLAVLAVCGMPLRDRITVPAVATAGVGASLLFFLVSNFGVWATGGGFSRPRTLTGLAQCYADALRFYPATLLSIAVFLPILYSPLCLVRASRPGYRAA